MRAAIEGLANDRLETGFEDFKHGLSEAEAVAEAHRCIHCFDAPCIRACPTSIDIPRFIKRIGSGHFRGAAKTILDSNILGLSCARSCPVEVLCEGACVYNDLDGKPISIGKLQRFAVERAYETNARFYEPGKPTGKRVALVGAGPASLACAHELRRSGFDAVIFEKSFVPGGLNTTGIAPYKMKADVGLREIDRILDMGVQIHFGAELGRDVKLEALLNEYDAVFLGLGLGPDSRLKVPGGERLMDEPEGSRRVWGAVDLISSVKTAPARELAWLREAKTALVVGGGNTALDACRELKGLGVPIVVVSYRRSEKDMSGYAHELKAARQEGVEFRFNTLPVRIEKAEAGLLVTLAATVVDASGKITILAEEQLALRASFVVAATGQSKFEGIFKGVKGMVFENGRLVVDPATGRTGNPKVFAGGDLANGGTEVVNAVADGMRAARAIIGDCALRAL